MTTVLANLATATGADRATIAELTKSLAELTAVTKAQAEELRRLIQSGHLAPLQTTTQHRSSTVVRGNGRQRRSGSNEQAGGGRPLYKTQKINYCWSHVYQVRLQHTSATCTESKAGHNPAATKSNIMGGDTWGSEFL
jgi:nitroreductase